MRTLVVLGALAFASLVAGHDPIGYAVVVPLEDSVMKASKICTDCVNFVGDIRDMLPKIQEQLDQLIDQMACDKLGPFSEVCKDLVQQLSNYVMNVLQKLDDPNEVCGGLGFCNQSTSEAFIIKKMAYLMKQTLTKKLKGAEECDACKAVITEVKTFLQQPGIQQDVEDFLDNEVCSALGAAADQCKQYVDAYTPLVFEILVNELDPVADCVYVGLCTNTSMSASVSRVGLASSRTNIRVIKPAKVKSSKAKVDASLQCVVCEFAMKEIDQILGSNRSEQAVKHALDTVCGLLPSTITQECVDFVNQYGAAVIALLVQELDPDVICKAIGLCNDTLVTEKVVRVSSPECDLCEMAMNYFVELLKTNKSEEFVKHLLEEVCGKFSANMTQQCDAFVDEYTVLVMDLIANDLDPKTLCVELKLCSSTAAAAAKDKKLRFKPQILGREECTYGPSFWCASRANAEKCGAKEHCEKHVWN